MLNVAKAGQAVSGQSPAPGGKQTIVIAAPKGTPGTPIIRSVGHVFSIHSSIWSTAFLFSHIYNPAATYHLTLGGVLTVLSKYMHLTAGATPSKIISSGGQIQTGAGGTRYIVVTTKPGQTMGAMTSVQAGSQVMHQVSGGAQGKPMITIVTSASALQAGQHGVQVTSAVTSPIVTSSQLHGNINMDGPSDDVIAPLPQVDGAGDEPGDGEQTGDATEGAEQAPDAPEAEATDAPQDEQGAPPPAEAVQPQDDQVSS